MIPVKELHAMGVNFVENLLKDKGRVMPQMLIHVCLEGEPSKRKEIDVIAMEVTNEDEKKQMKCRAAIKSMIRKCREKGVFEGALMVSEAWMASLHKNESHPGRNKAKDHSSAKEVIIVSAWVDSDNKFNKCWEITGKEGDKSRSLGNTVMETSDFESWVSESFQ